MTINQLKTLCVILHYGSEVYTNECIKSLENARNLDIVISDNDPSQSYIPLKKFNKFVKIIRTGGLVGFSKGNNLGVKRYLTKEHGSVLILNNDTIVTDGALNFLKETLNKKNVGAVGPCMPFARNVNKIWACGGYINKLTLKVCGFSEKKKQLPLPSRLFARSCNFDRCKNMEKY